MEFMLETRQNTILSVHLNGDFFGSVEAEEICALLIGTELEPDALTKALTPLAGRIMGITPSDIAQGLCK